VLNMEQTIVGIASAPGAAARGLIRLSGREVAHVVSTCFRAESDVDWRRAQRPHRTAGRLHLSGLRLPVPAALLYWPTHRSYTCEPMAELHLVGSPPLLDAAVAEFCQQGARPATRGEFTLRAFLAGRISLLQAEAVLGVIEASDHAELETAINQLGGGVTDQLRAVRTDLIALLGDLEAGLDFVEEDIEFVSREDMTRRIQSAAGCVRRLRESAAQRLPSGRRPRVVIAGLPNAGKSTLFNRLVGARRAIVSPVAGTTRDYVSATTVLNGTGIELIDTAGWESPVDAIMQDAQALRAEQLVAGDLIIWCSASDLESEFRARDVQLREALKSQVPALLHVLTCCDRHSGDFLPPDDPANALRVSVRTDQGIADLTDQVAKRLRNSGAARGELLGISAARCQDSLLRAGSCLDAALTAIMANRGEELVADEIRQSLREFSVILGEVYTDDILDHIFSRFCIGK
jgi:tRNA modification GTPase